MNSLKQDFSTPYSTAPFSKIKNEDFLPAIEEGIETAKKEIQEIIDNPEAPNFKNTLEAMAYSGMHLDRITSIFFNLHSAETNDELENIAQEVAPKLSEFSNDITLNPALFQRIKSVYDQKDKLTLTPEQEMLLVSNYKSFVRNGALLNEEEKQKLREIMNELSTLTLTFGKNVLVEQNAYQLHLTNEKDGEGLPQGIIEAAAELAKAENKEGWIFTLDYPSYIPFMKFAKNRELRKELAIANGKKAFQNNENNNEKVAIRIAQLRFERAKLLGYETHKSEEHTSELQSRPHLVCRLLLEKKKKKIKKKKKTKKTKTKQKK